MDYRKMFDDKEHLYAFDLDGVERTLEIERVVAGELTGEKARKTKKPMVSFVGEKKKLAINKTNGKTIAALYGTDTDRWVGRLITIYPTTTDFGGNTVDCIRVKPMAPSPGSAGRAPRGDRKPSAARPSASANDLLARITACGDDAALTAVIADSRAAWGSLSKEDRERVTAAIEDARERVAVATDGSGEPPPVTEEEAAEIAKDEREAAARGE